MSKRSHPRKVRTNSKFGVVVLFVSLGSFAVNYYLYHWDATADASEASLTNGSANEVKVATIQVPVPDVDIEAGTALRDVSFRNVPWSVSDNIALYVLDMDFLQTQLALRRLRAGNPVPIASLGSDTRDTNVVVDGIPSGMRAITVRVDIESAVEGWARSGNYVDVIVLRSVSSDKGLEATVIAENVRILSAGRSTSPVSPDAATSPQAPGTVTLLVSQDDALRIKAGASVGRLTFSLRGRGDESPTLAKSMSQKELMEGGSAKVPSIDFVGTAKGPDGQDYLLTKDSKWMRSSSRVAKTVGSVQDAPQGEPAKQGS